MQADGSWLVGDVKATSQTDGSTVLCESAADRVTREVEYAMVDCRIVEGKGGADSKRTAILCVAMPIDSQRDSIMGLDL